MNKKEWGLTMAQTLAVEAACGEVAAKLAAARKAKAGTAVIYKCQAEEVKLPAAGRNCVVGSEIDWSAALADESNPALSGSARMVALNCVQKGYGKRLVVQFVNFDPHLAIRLD